VTYRELDDLSHTYPREMNAPILNWLRASAEIAAASARSKL
jgi:phospholipase/carboxylesterase